MTSAREARSAGISPQTIAVTTPANTAKASTTGSIATASSRGRSFGPSASSTSMPARARIRPRPVPHAAITRLSASIWRTSCPRLAPIAARTASSRLRPAARTTSRLATLAHAISSTNATAPISDTIVGRTSPTRSSNIGIDVKVQAGGLLDREMLAQVGRDVVDLDLRLVGAHAGLEPADHAVEHVVAVGGVDVDPRRGPHLRRALGVDAGRQQQLEAWRQDADDARAPVAELDVLADDGLIAAETPQPERVTQDRGHRRTRRRRLSRPAAAPACHRRRRNRGRRASARRGRGTGSSWPRRRESARDQPPGAASGTRPAGIIPAISSKTSEDCC